MNALKPWKRIHMLQDIDTRKYYEGFRVGREKKMFEEELKDIELTYKGTLIHLHKQLEDCLPSLLHYMEEFLTLHKQNEEVRDKLEALLAKTGRENEEDDEDEDE
jgi:hypothetical protein